MSIVKVMMMQKNEGNYLARWLAHYQYLFGAHNLYIFDNGSDDPYTLSLLQEAQYQGVHVDRTLSQKEDWQRKGAHFTSMIEALDRDEHYDFALPVDCDEIICVFTERGLSLNKNDILEEFSRLKSFRCAFGMNFSLFNVPNHHGWYAPNRHFPKGFVPARCQAIIDDGHHFPISQEDNTRLITRLTYLHHHHRPFNEMQELSRQKLALEVDIHDRNKLLEHAQHARPGGHLVRFLLEEKKDYEQMYNNEIQFFFDGGDIILKTPQGVRFWNKDAYLKRHPDVASYEPGPLNHYLMYGYHEKRELS